LKPSLLEKDEGEREMKPILLLLMSAVSASMGQVLFRKGVLVTGEVNFKTSILSELSKLVFNPVVFSGLILYFVGTVLWLIALSKTTLNFAYPFTALTFVLVMVSSKVIFLENIPTLRYFGVILIILGLLLSSAAKG
jgi:multidrug transporter EmrE-like cation transporter